MQRQVPAVLRVRHPSDSVHRQCVGHSCYATETGIRSATVQVAGSVHSCSLADEVAAALVVDIGISMFTAGFAGNRAILAVLPLIGDRPKIFGILVGMDQKVCVSLRSARSYFSAMLGSTVVSICVRLRIFSYFSAMLGSTVVTICVRLRIFSYSSAMLGLTVDTSVALVVVLAVASFLPVCWLR